MGNFEKLGYLNDDFRIFHLVDNEKKEFNFHYHDFNKIMIFLSGSLNYSVEGRNYSLKPYDILLVNAGEVHRPVCLDNSVYDRIIVYVSTEFLASYKGEDYDLSHCFEKVRKEHSNVLRIPSLDKSKLYHVCRELELSFKDNDFARELYQKILFLEFMIQLNRTVIANHVNYLDSDMANDKLLAIIDYINAHLTEDLTIDTLANTFYLNRYYLMHFFKEHTGYTVGNYITDKRLLLARHYVQSGYTSTQACYQSGFKNYSTFSRAFKKAFKTMPKNAPFID